MQSVNGLLSLRVGFEVVRFASFLFCGVWIRLCVCFALIMVVICGLILWLFVWVFVLFKSGFVFGISVCLLFISGVGLLIVISVVIVAFMLIVCFG